MSLPSKTINARTDVREPVRKMTFLEWASAVKWCDMDERWYFKHDTRRCSCTQKHGCTFLGEPIGKDLFERQQELELEK